MARSLTPEIDRVLLDTHTTATYPEAVRELRRVRSVLRAAELALKVLPGADWDTDQEADDGSNARWTLHHALARLQRRETKR